MLSLRAPAKINVTLEVLARRADGFHGVRSVMVPLDLADELTIEPSDRFSFHCDRAELESSANLVVAAFEAVGAPPPIRVNLHKHVPVQAGLGGGSSDAAAVLRGAMEGAFGVRPDLDWLRIARALGSDVPFFLAGSAALVEGTGERVTPAGTIPQWHVLILKPPASISTADAYRELDRIERPQRPRDGSISIAALEALQRGDFTTMESLMQNDFTEPIARHSREVGIALDALRSAGASNALLAGSGSCVFTIAVDRAHLEAIAERIPLSPSYERFFTRFAKTPGWR